MTASPSQHLELFKRSVLRPGCRIDWFALCCSGVPCWRDLKWNQICSFSNLLKNILILISSCEPGGRTFVLAAFFYFFWVSWGWREGDTGFSQCWEFGVWGLAETLTEVLTDLQTLSAALSACLSRKNQYRMLFVSPCFTTAFHSWGQADTVCMLWLCVLDLFFIYIKNGIKFPLKIPKMESPLHHRG